MTSFRASNSSSDETSSRRPARSTPAEAPRTGLFGRRKDSGDPLQESVDCLIGPDAEITGDLIFTGGLRIDGRVKARDGRDARSIATAAKRRPGPKPARPAGVARAR